MSAEIVIDNASNGFETAFSQSIHDHVSLDASPIASPRPESSNFRNISEISSLEETLLPEPPKKRIRRTKAQIAVDNAKATKESSQASNCRFTVLEYKRMVTYIEPEERYNELFGAGKATKINGQILLKSKAFDKFANWMNAGSYQAAAKIESETGSGLTDEDKAAGLKSILDEQNQICPEYLRIHKIFRGKANIVGKEAVDSCRQNRQIKNPAEISANSTFDFDINNRAESNDHDDDNEFVDEYASIDGGFINDDDDEPVLINPNSNNNEAQHNDFVSPNVTDHSRTSRSAERALTNSRKRPMDESIEYVIPSVRPKARPNAVALEFDRHQARKDMRECMCIEWEREKFKLQSSQHYEQMELERASRKLDRELAREMREKELADLQAERLHQEKLRSQNQEERRAERAQALENSKAEKAAEAAIKLQNKEKDHAFVMGLLGQGVTGD
ncbi:hypothetical protein K3495_g14616 [Podosphaera aphanis]|nr:hypothetical protein K3495_g14616 [Podosphaera aphanis]